MGKGQAYNIIKAEEINKKKPTLTQKLLIFMVFLKEMPYMYFYFFWQSQTTKRLCKLQRDYVYMNKGYMHIILFLQWFYM